MSKGIIPNISKVAELENPARAERHNFSDDEPTVADLVFPGSDYRFSDEFVERPRVLGGKRDFA